MPESASSISTISGLPSALFFSAPSGPITGTFHRQPGSVLRRQSTSKTKSLNDFVLHKLLSRCLDSLRASQSMTPSFTFQWPLSPSGTFQPERSVPLNSEVKPSGGVLFSAHKPIPNSNTMPATPEIHCQGFMGFSFLMLSERPASAG